MVPRLQADAAPQNILYEAEKKRSASAFLYLILFQLSIDSSSDS